MSKKFAEISRTLLCCLSVLGFSHVHGQIRGLPQRQNEPDRSQGIQVFTGKTAVDRGSEQPQHVTVVLECGGVQRGHTITDRKGNFSLIENVNESSEFSTSMQPESLTSSSAGICVLYGDAPGYTSERVYVLDQPSGDVTEVRTIMLHAVATPDAHEGSTVSVVSLAAPVNARKAFEKGQQQARKKNWQSASGYYQEALQLYPRYAAAWLELGRAQLQANSLQQAQESLKKAAAQRDDHFTAIAANTELMALAAKQKDWALLAVATDELAKLSTDLAPKVWFFNSVAKLNLGDVTAAERSVKQALTSDSKHTLPQLEYLYGVILVKEHNYVTAIAHIRTYLELAPHADNVASAHTLLSQLEAVVSQSDKTASR